MARSEDRRIDELEVSITDELVLAESSRPDDPVVESDRGWRPNPSEVKAYEARLLSLRGALEAGRGERTVHSVAVAESLTAVVIEREEEPDVSGDQEHSGRKMPGSVQR
jgi:hypothetical protein